MGPNLLILAGTFLLPLSQHDTTDQPEQPSHGIGYERLSDALRYNRVQGLALGLGYRLFVPGASTAVYATVRYGLSDERVTGRLSIVRQLRGGEVRLSGYSEVEVVDPLTSGGSFSNTLNALFAGHDNGDYSFSRGASMAWITPTGTRTTLELALRLEQGSSAARTARSAVNDFLGGTGVFQPNPPIRAGTFGGVTAHLRGAGPVQWTVNLEGVGGQGVTVARAYGTVSGSYGSGLSLTFRGKAGTATEPGLPPTLFRLGGLNTVRGFEYGTLRGSCFWSAQADVRVLPGRIRPLLFADAGQAGNREDLFSSAALIGVGAGLELLKGLMRFEVSKPVSPYGGKARFDLTLAETW
jgi:Omp85 superfamily domain